MSNLGAIKTTLKTGNEGFIFNGKRIERNLVDFWKWSVSDLVSNATRGRLAEFIVACALDIEITTPRGEWQAYDLITKEGIKLEIKSAAYLQSWYQKNYSKISFSIKKSRSWDVCTGKMAKTARRHVDAYVFCLLAHKDKKTVNPRDLSQWQFYVLSIAEVENYPRSQSSITLKSLRKLTGKHIVYNQLQKKVYEKTRFDDRSK